MEVKIINFNEIKVALIEHRGSQEDEYGIKDGLIPNLRCALARDIGSRSNNKAIVYLTEEWLPRSGERIANFPIIFHYVNVGPNVKPEEMVTDVYLPLA